MFLFSDLPRETGTWENENWESVKPKLSGTVLEERSIDAMRNAMEEYFHGKEEDKLISSGFYGD